MGGILKNFKTLIAKQYRKLIIQNDLKCSLVCWRKVPLVPLILSEKFKALKKIPLQIFIYFETKLLQN